MQIHLSSFYSSDLKRSAGRFEKQAKRFGAQIKWCGIERVDLTCRPFKVYCEDGEVMTSSAIIIATGASPRWLGAPGEYEYRGRGVSSCATCDGFAYAGKRVLVIGGGIVAIAVDAEQLDTGIVDHRRHLLHHRGGRGRGDGRGLPWQLLAVHAALLHRLHEADGEERVAAAARVGVMAR